MRKQSFATLKASVIISLNADNKRLHYYLCLAEYLIEVNFLERQIISTHKGNCALLVQSTGKISSPSMSLQTAYQALYRVTVVYLPFVAAAVIFAVAYHLKKQADIERPLKGFPLVGFEEEGLSPKEAWMKHGPRVMANGLKAHQGAFQVMTGTGPKVRRGRGYTIESNSMSAAG